MPVVRPLMLGGTASITPPCNMRRTIVLSADGAVATSPLLVEGLPNLFLWARQTTAGALATMEWQWSARAATAVIQPTDDWQPVFPATSTPLAAANANVFYERGMSAKRVRLLLTRAPGIATTVEVFYGGRT